MRQNELFHEDIYEALRTDILALGGTKKVGLLLWPEKKLKAGDHLNNCLNSTRNEKLDAEQILLIKSEAKKAGSFATVFFECDEIGMTRPSPIEPEDQKAALQREFISTVEGLNTLAGKLEKLGVSL